MGEPSVRATSLWKSFGYALEGLRHAVRTQRNLRIHLAIAALVVGVGVFLDLPLRDWAVLALTIGAVLTGELINTVVEAVVDLASPEYHDLAKVAKDVAAGTVLVMALTAISVGLLILGPPLWALLNTP
jgi:diacylglycerol kinase